LTLIKVGAIRLCGFDTHSAGEVLSPGVDFIIALAQTAAAFVLTVVIFGGVFIIVIIIFIFTFIARTGGIGVAVLVLVDVQLVLSLLRRVGLHPPVLAAAEFLASKVLGLVWTQTLGASIRARVISTAESC